jgi:hypothetical protein
MNFKECNDEEVKKIKNWCGPSDRMWFTKHIPQLFPCACRKHDTMYGQKQTFKSAMTINDNFLLRMIYTTNKNIKWYNRPFYYAMAIVFYFAVVVAIPYYVYFIWRKMEE